MVGGMLLGGWGVCGGWWCERLVERGVVGWR